MSTDPPGAGPVDWSGKTAPAIEATAAEAGSIVVLPIGSVEQHGDHLPTGTDTFLADAIARLGAKRTDAPTLVAPAFWSGFSPHHLPFGGTLTLSFETMLAAVEEIAESALENGFDAILLVNGHGGNSSLISAATSTIGQAHPEAAVLGLTYFELAAEWIDEYRDSEPGGMAHGGEFETSLLAYLRPELVGEPDGETPNLEEPYDRGDRGLLEPGTLSVYRSFDEYSDSGAIGAPEQASAETGEQLYDRLGDELAEVLAEIHERTRENSDA